MYPTPNLSHLTLRDYQTVYEPAEDTFALLDALELDIEFLASFKTPLVLEIGSGSGCVSSFLHSLLDNSIHVCTDINPYAINATIRTFEKNNCYRYFCLHTSLSSGLRGPFDIILFNPPYVPTSQSEDPRWSGGANGMKTTSKLINSIPRILSPRGVLYLVHTSLNPLLDITDSFDVTVHKYLTNTLTVRKYWRGRPVGNGFRCFELREKKNHDDTFGR